MLARHSKWQASVELAKKVDPRYYMVKRGSVRLHDGAPEGIEEVISELGDDESLSELWKLTNREFPR